MTLANLENLAYYPVPAGTYELGWRFNGRLPVAANAALDAFWAWPELRTHFSAQRRVDVAAFHIARDSVSLEALMGDPWATAGTPSVVGNRGRWRGWPSRRAFGSTTRRWATSWPSTWRRPSFGRCASGEWRGLGRLERGRRVRVYLGVEFVVGSAGGKR